MATLASRIDLSLLLFMKDFANTSDMIERDNTPVIWSDATASIIKEARVSCCLVDPVLSISGMAKMKNVSPNMVR